MIPYAFIVHSKSDDLSSCSLYIAQKAQNHLVLDDNCIMYNNHPIMDDYRWSIIIHFWNRNIPRYYKSTYIMLQCDAHGNRQN